jgi:hypothetical protein
MAFLRPGLKRAFSAMLFLGAEFLGLRPISVNLRLWDGSLPRRGQKDSARGFNPDKLAITEMFYDHHYIICACNFDLTTND